MKKDKIYFEFIFSKTPTGGGNQFLSLLKEMFKKEDMLSETAENATVILFNSHQRANEVYSLKKLYGNSKLFVHRLDGLPALYNKIGDERQAIAMEVNKIADKTVFQSYWSKQKFIEFGLNPKNDTVIHNASNPSIFYPATYKENKKVTIITSSWSNNQRKGFGYMSHLDNNLDFCKYDYIFIGNSPVVFKNIKSIGVLDSIKLSEYLRLGDIFFTATENDACSNSLIEALSCSLPVVALKSGGNPELVLRGGELFDNLDEAVNSMEKVSSNIKYYRERIIVPSIIDIFKNYKDFIYGQQ